MLQSLYGFGWDVSQAGWTREEANNFFEKIKKDFKADKTMYRSSSKEWLFFFQTHKATLMQLGEEEYHTLTGYDFKEGMRLLNAIEKIGLN